MRVSVHPVSIYVYISICKFLRRQEHWKHIFLRNRSTKEIFLPFALFFAGRCGHCICVRLFCKRDLKILRVYYCTTISRWQTPGSSQVSFAVICAMLFAGHFCGIVCGSFSILCRAILLLLTRIFRELLQIRVPICCRYQSREFCMQ